MGRAHRAAELLGSTDSRFASVMGTLRGAPHDPQSVPSTEFAITVRNDRDRLFTFRVVPAGTGYGRGRKVITDHALVEVFDATYANDGRFEPEGQIISQYDLETMLEHGGHGLDLHGGIDVWKVDAAAMAQVAEFLANFR